MVSKLTNLCKIHACLPKKIKNKPYFLLTLFTQFITTTHVQFLFKESCFSSKIMRYIKLTIVEQNPKNN